jgi:AraC-like DNA-binding protein
MGSRETDSLLERLAPSPDSGDAPRFLVQPSIGAALPVLREIVAMHSAVSHPLAWLHASAKAMELLHVTLRDKSMLLDGGERRFRLTSRDRHLLGQAREILGREFVDPPSLSALARRIGLNTSKLCFGFRHEYGETTSEFVRRQRLAHAKTLLQETELQVREVARRCGYQHHSTFTAAFVRTFGMSPKGMRRIAEAARRTAA